MALVSITRLRVRALRYLPAFLINAARSTPSQLRSVKSRKLSNPTGWGLSFAPQIKQLREESPSSAAYLPSGACSAAAKAASIGLSEPEQGILLDFVLPPQETEKQGSSYCLFGPAGYERIRGG
jgi:hypothetical protein